MAIIPPFQSQHLEAVCRVLADTQRGLTGSQIGRVLQEIDVQDVTPEIGSVSLMRLPKSKIKNMPAII